MSGGDWDALKRRKRERDRERAITVRLLSKFNNEPAPYPIPIGRVVASVLVITGAALLGLVRHALGQPLNSGKARRRSSGSCSSG